eukprot:TRINITY_DN96173_c0_g1_i1.p1 TRINITY_DN96173_c0_g1~~TRINITY_DN96173_c0_g1_i1.p1  ORF type:complete len:383 (-),score=57.22 TRINITY_DN96173_c0_g1_i1:7-1155(-)
MKWECNWKAYYNQIPAGSLGPVDNADSDKQAFLESPMGFLRRHFEATHGVRLRPGRKRIPAQTESAPVVLHQLTRDIEQFEYLLSKGVLENHVESFVNNSVLPDFRNALDFATDVMSRRNDPSYTLSYQKQFASFFSLHRRALHLHPGDATPGAALRARDFEALEQSYAEKEHRVVVMDDFLSEATLQVLRDFLLESTFWFDVHEGYVGTYMHTGFSSALVSQIDEEIRASFPKVLKDLELRNAWAYMFDGSLGGIKTHADDAQVQINIFLTPSEANLWSQDGSNPSGGLVVFGIGPPEGWDLFDLMSDGADSVIAERILSTGNFNLTVPYVQNRAVMFDSTYFHRTDDMKFEKGYTNRRINLTFLYGAREKLKNAPTLMAT